jgi:hypothetical protein
MRPISNGEIVGALREARAAHEREVMQTLVRQERAKMKSGIQTAARAAAVAPAEAVTAPLVPNQQPPAIPVTARRRASEAIGRLRALHEAILADRGGKPFGEEELTAALQDARAAHEQGE